MPIARAELEVQAPIEQEIDELKKEICGLYASCQSRRLELGIKLIRLRTILAHRGVGTFTKVVTIELKIPHTTVYDVINYATAEIDRNLRATADVP